MALAATFEPADSRVRLAATGLAGAATATFFHRPAGAGTWDVVRGGADVALAGGAATVYDHEFPAGYPAARTAEYRLLTNTAVENLASAAVTIADRAWLKWPGYPFLNRPVTITGRGPITRAPRGSVIPIANAAAPAAVQEWMSGRQYPLILRTETWAEWTELDAALALGAIVYLHTDDAALACPSMYAVVTALSSVQVGSRRAETRRVEITLTEVAKPAHAYAGAVGTWQTVLTNYASWQAVLTAHTSWAQLLQIEGSAADVIVG